MRPTNAEPYTLSALGTICAADLDGGTVALRGDLHLPRGGCAVRVVRSADVRRALGHPREP